ncbi:Hsp70 family protein [Catenuloplanes atrovinosus]|uniref:Hsp70 protein n=1 Tax=Catenuloplanes atrovinosus TaxID=137266 RepID=A0AAE4C8Z0_9ACTN|nr:Hsp70 family protein [Catenuloplanes atrovinosus]MDR7276026.1 hypothetical protein [Catenuloplanes atrovinosus]
MHLGVDFGTSSTVAMFTRPGEAARPLLFGSSPLLDSAVAAAADGTILTGADAAATAAGTPEGFEPHPKRRVDDGTMWLGGRELPVAVTIGAVLHRVASEATRVLGAGPRQVTLTHPAAWGPARVRVLADAAAFAGFPTVRMLPEPLAAAAFFAATLGHTVPPGHGLAVYDLGAGTFDLSVVRADPAGFAVAASDGLVDVGGLDLDALVVGLARRRLATRAPAEWSRLDQPRTMADRRSRSLLWQAARATKEQLSRHDDAPLYVPLLETEIRIARPEFEAEAAPLLERTVALTRATLTRAGGLPLSGLLLVGGASRVPLVASLLHRAFGVWPIATEQPELVVAQGALAAVHLHGAAGPPPPSPGWPPRPGVPAPAGYPAAPPGMPVSGASAPPGFPAPPPVSGVPAAHGPVPPGPAAGAPTQPGWHGGPAQGPVSGPPVPHGWPAPVPTPPNSQPWPPQQPVSGPPVPPGWPAPAPHTPMSGGPGQPGQQTWPTHGQPPGTSAQRGWSTPPHPPSGFPPQSGWTPAPAASPPQPGGGSVPEPAAPPAFPQQPGRPPVPGAPAPPVPYPQPGRPPVSGAPAPPVPYPQPGRPPVPGAPAPPAPPLQPGRPPVSGAPAPSAYSAQPGWAPIPGAQVPHGPPSPQGWTGPASPTAPVGWQQPGPPPPWQQTVAYPPAAVPMSGHGYPRVEPVEIAIGGTAGVTLRWIELAPDGDGGGGTHEEPMFLAAGGRLQLFESADALVAYVRGGPAHDLAARPGWPEFARWVVPPVLVPAPEHRYELDLVVDNVVGGRDAWMPELLIPAGVIARDLAYALRLTVWRLLEPGSLLDTFDDALRQNNKRRLRGLDFNRLIYEWRTVVDALAEAVDIHAIQ